MRRTEAQETDYLNLAGMLMLLETAIILYLLFI
jgi:hypothetical protein